jgi:hypothetical protein
MIVKAISALGLTLIAATLTTLGLISLSVAAVVGVMLIVKP